MPDLTDRACDLAKRLLSENRSGRSGRKIAREDYGNQVHFATLNRIALSRGEWLPKERRILMVLGLVEIKRHKWLPGEWKAKRKIGEMAKETEQKVLRKRGA